MRLFFIPILLTTYFFLCVSVIPVVNAAENRWLFKNQDLKLRIVARSNEQMAAFYEARGFPQESIKNLQQFCFFTVGIANKSNEVILLDLEQWSFHSAEKKFKRYHRNVLKKYWQESGLEKRLISTFRWTLLPEKLDFRPDEHEGGNIVVSRTPLPFNIEARFIKGTENTREEIKVKLNNIHCFGNEP